MTISNTIEQGGRVVSGNLDILVIEEKKIDSTFPEAQFYIPWHKKSFRKDSNVHGENSGILSRGYSLEKIVII